MAITNGYCTLADVKSALRLTDGDDDALLENAIEGASRRIDGYCNTFFFQKAATVDFFPQYEDRLSVPDLASQTLTLRTDDAGDGTYSTTWLSSDYVLTPTDSALTGRPWRTILAVGSKSFPVNSQVSRPTVRVIGTFGWPSVPDDVREACVLLAMRGFARYNSALGVVGFADMAIQVRAVDPDVRDLLMPYRTLAVA